VIAAVVLAVVGLVVATVGLLGLTERLPVNRFAGVRTTATMRDADTFRVGNKAAGLPVAVAGLVGLAGGLLGLATVVATVVAAVGMIAIALAGGMLGHRAALAVPEPEKELPAGCAGCACGTCGVKKLVESDVTGVRGE
jgi:hypothetical protein